jgi:hypothetical protein
MAVASLMSSPRTQRGHAGTIVVSDGERSVVPILIRLDDNGQYPDGLRAPMIIHDREWEASLGLDREFVFSVSDWCVIRQFFMGTF